MRAAAENGCLQCFCCSPWHIIGAQATNRFRTPPKDQKAQHQRVMPQELNCTKTVAGNTTIYAACASLAAVFNGGYDLYWTLDEKVHIAHGLLLDAPLCSSTVGSAVNGTDIP